MFITTNIYFTYGEKNLIRCQKLPKLYENDCRSSSPLSSALSNPLSFAGSNYIYTLCHSPVSTIETMSCTLNDCFKLIF